MKIPCPSQVAIRGATVAVGRTTLLIALVTLWSARLGFQLTRDQSVPVVAGRSMIHKCSANDSARRLFVTPAVLV